MKIRKQSLRLMIASLLLTLACNQEKGPQQESYGDVSYHDTIPIKGLTIHDKASPKVIQVSESFDIVKLKALLEELRNRNMDFAIYDPLYPTSPDDDQGAYMSYSLEKAEPDCWSMTLGNHGWSGGIYQIPEKTVLIQLQSLVKHKLLKEIQISNVGFLSHYEVETQAANKRQIQTIENAHLRK